MFLWVTVFCTSSFYIAATLACNGCQIDEDLTITSCAETTEQIMLFSCEKMQLTDDCYIESNCSRVVVESVTSAELAVTGSVNGYDFSYHHPDLCKALDEKNFDGKDIANTLDFYNIADGCGNPKDYSNFEIRRRKMDEKLAGMVDKGKGKSEVRMELRNVNGKEGHNSCYEIKASLSCEKHQRKPKGH